MTSTSRRERSPWTVGLPGPSLSAISMKAPVVPVVLLGVLVVCGIVPASGSLLAQSPPVPPDPQTHGFAFTRFVGDSRAAVAVDNAGYMYVTGSGSNRTVSDNVRDVLAVSLQMYLGERGGDRKDVFVAKFTPDGHTQIYVRHLAGSREDVGTAIAVDESGHAYVTGITYSNNFPATALSGQRPSGQNCFVTKLSADGSKVLYSTLLGGEKQDRCIAIALDGKGNAYVTGSTNSTTFAASNVVNSRALGKDWDVFAAKLAPEGRRLEYVLRFGGTAGREPDAGKSGGEFATDIAVDGAGTAYIVGQTDSADFPIRTDRQPIPGAFVVRVNATGSGLLSGTYLGNASRDAAVAVDTLGDVYVTWTTPMSTSTPAQAPRSIAQTFADVLGAGDSTCSSPGSVHDDKPCRRYPFTTTTSGELDTILTWSGNADLDIEAWRGSTRVISSLRIAGSKERMRTTIAAGAYEVRVYNSGTTPVNYTLQMTRPQSLKIGNGQRVSVAKLTPVLDRLVYSSAITIPFSVTTDIAVDGLGRAHVAGSTERGDLFPTLRPLQRTYEGDQAFLLILDGAGVPVLSSTVGFKAGGAGVAVDGSGGIYLAGTGRSTFGRTLGERSSGGFVSKVVLRTATAAQVQVPTPVPTEIEFVKIPPGEFSMRCDSYAHRCRSQNSHRVRITKGFEIGKYEVTQTQWLAVMDSSGSRFTGPDLPVEQVGWAGVQEFLRRMNARQDGSRYRLPTEAEWEYAARAEFSCKDVEAFDEAAWNFRNADLETHPVGQKKANAWGLFDMWGNVWELVQDWYGEFPKGLQVDPVGPASGTRRVARGGSFATHLCTAGYRADPASTRDSDYRDSAIIVGFRLVRDPVSAGASPSPSADVRPSDGPPR